MSDDVRITLTGDGCYAILRGDQNLVSGLTEEEASQFRAKFAQKKRLKAASQTSSGPSEGSDHHRPSR